jgi:hypothetical protein
MVEFETKIEFDNFSLEMVEFDFFIKILQSKKLFVDVEEDDQNVNI